MGVIKKGGRATMETTTLPYLPLLLVTDAAFRYEPTFLFHWLISSFETVSLHYQRI